MCAEFWSRVVKTNECWFWTGALTNGYGRFRRMSAHRWIHSHLDQKNPSGMDTCHDCFNRACVRPSHLHWGTRSQNMLEAGAVGRLGTFEKSKTHCPRGHEYDAVKSNGDRCCMTCRRESEKKRRRQARLAARPAPAECKHCDGVGQVRVLGFPEHGSDIYEDCFYCKGTGRADPRPAPTDVYVCNCDTNGSPNHREWCIEEKARRAEQLTALVRELAELLEVTQGPLGLAITLGEWGDRARAALARVREARL